MSHTLEELESLLEGRALVGRVLHQVPGVEPGADYVITDVDYFPLSRIVELRSDAGRCTFTLKDVEKLLDGQRVGGMGKWQNKAYTLLPAEEEPAKAEEPRLITWDDSFMSAEPKAEPEVPTEQPTAEQLAEMEANAQWLQAATEFFAKEPERTYTTAELISKLGMLRSAVATTREQSKPAKPALSAKWEERWWDMYLRHYVKGFPNAAAIADKAIEVARKHLEGEA